MHPECIFSLPRSIEFFCVELKKMSTFLAFVGRGYPVVVHPDVIFDRPRWRVLGEALFIENMDKRKPVGRTVEELQEFFRDLPAARFCFDIGHARQVDPSMTERL